MEINSRNGVSYGREGKFLLGYYGSISLVGLS